MRRSWSITAAIGSWRPGNYERDFSGPTPLRVALEQSLNLVTLRVAPAVGMQAVADNAIAFHMVDNMPRVLPAALGAVRHHGAAEAGAYASIDAGGREVVPTLIDSVQDRDGHVVWRPPGWTAPTAPIRPTPPQLTDDRKQIADPDSVFQLITMMQGVVQRGTGVPAAQGLEPADRRQDRHHAGLHRRLVLRLHRRPGDRGVGRLRQPGHARRQRDRRRGRRADLARLHGGGAEGPAGAAVPAAAGRDHGAVGQRLRAR